MRKPLTITQLRNAVETRRHKVATSVNSFKGNNNPQVVEMYLKAKGELEALESVLEAINQRTVYFLEN
jgi:hypothetical protein